MNNASVNGSRRHDHTPLLSSLVVGVGALAWLAMLMLHENGHSHGHAGHLRDLCISEGLAVALLSSGLLWMYGWAVMVLAMMLPPALPMLRMMARLTKNCRNPWLPVGAAAMAFVAVWVAAGIVLWSAGTLLASALIGVDSLTNRGGLISGVAALLAGAYQFTPLKKACLTACRRPESFALTHWSSDTPLAASAQIGMRYGAVCVGCCWALMILSFAVGAMALPIMVIVSVVMLLERLLPSVRPLIPLQAALACGIGLLLLFGIIPPGFLVF